MPRRKKSLFEWWMERINKLVGLKPSPDEILSIVSKRVPHYDEYIYTKGVWIGIKLSILAYYLDVYTIVARNHFDEICYVDTFAGSGIVKIIEGNDSMYLYGSSILSILVPRISKKFDKYFFVELDQHKAIILENVIKALDELGIVDHNKVRIIQGDMNKVNYFSLLKECKHSLIFIDPEGTEPRWNTINNLLRLDADLLFNFMISGIRRAWGNWRKGNLSEVPALDEFYGDNSWTNAKNEEDLLNIYIDKLVKNHRIVIPIMVKASRLFYYYILLIVRPTRGGNPWLEPINRYLKPRIERTDSLTFSRLLGVFRGKMRPLF